MRFDEINLIGDFKIDGTTGTSGQAIGFSGSNVEWINAASGGSQNQLTSTGYNYIIVAATGSNAQNGSTLLSAYSSLSSFSIGALGVDNRLTLFLTPGVYDFGSSFLSVQSYIDIVGLSRNPYDVVIKSTGATNFFIQTEDVDFALENVYLSGEKYWDDNSGLGGNYFRWKNLVIGGNTFDGTNFLDLNGEFKNIKVLDGANFAYVVNNIDGTYEDIEIGSVSNAFSCGAAITGNYKDITIGGISQRGFYSSAGNISINFFENVKFYNFTGTDILVCGANIYGQFKNITIPNNPSGKVFSTNISQDLGSPGSRFENIQIGNLSSAFSDINTINGVFKSIEIGDCGNVFTGIRIFDAAVEFEDIKIGNCTEVFTNDNDDISGKFRNITIGNISGGRAFASITHISGDFRNIIIGSASGNVFSGTSSIVSTFKNIEIGNVGNDLLCTDLFNSNIIGLKAGNIGNSFVAVTDTLDGEFKDIEIDNVAFRSLFVSNAIVATFSNIKMGNVSNRGPITSVFSTIGGSVKNFEAGNVAGFLRANLGFDTGYFAENVKFGDSDYPVFSSDTSGPIMESVKNVKMGNVNGSAFFADSGGTFSGTFENIKIDSANDCFFTNDSVFQDLTIRNLTIGSVSNATLTTDQPTNVTNDAFSDVIIKDVEIGSCGSDIFRTNVGTSMRIRNSRFENITIGTCSSVFRAIVGENTEIKNLYSTGNFGYDSISLAAKLINSNLNMSGRNYAPTFSEFTIDRTKIVTDIGFTVSLPSNVTSLYSIYSYAGLTAAGFSYSNIVDPDVTF
jgi:hypothetical protein